MLTLKLILLLVLVGWSLYSAVVYWSRRGDNKMALQSLQSDAMPVRSLTEEESAALVPFLFEPARPDRAMALRREGVFALNGAYVQHGLHTSQGGETLHDTLGGVEVILPYDAREHLDVSNQAEVAFTDKFAVVVRLNGTFDLLGGRSRALRRQQQDRQWQGGLAGEVTDVEPLDGDDAAAEREAQVLRQVLRVEMLGQRDETSAEMADRAGLGRSWLAVAAWALAFLAVLTASEAGAAERLAWSAPAAVLAALALWCTWGPRRVGAPGKVNRVRGHVAAIAMAKPGGGAGPVRWFVGDKFPVVLPARWQSRWAVPPEGPVDVEMRVADHTAVRFGKGLSVDEEVMRFAPARWGGHLLLAVTGALALGGMWLAASSLANDLVLTSAWLRGTPALTASTPEALAAGQPAVGTPVHLSGHAKCHWGPVGDGRAGVDCATLHWETSAAATAPVVLDDLTVALHDGSFLRSQSHAGLDLMLQMQMMGGGGDPLARYQAIANAPRVVTGLADLIRTIDTACPEASDACDRMRQYLTEGLAADGDDESAKSWATWAQQAARGELTGERDMAVMRVSLTSSIQTHGREVAEQRAAVLIQDALAARHAAAPGSVFLSVSPGDATHLPVAPEEMDVVGYIDALNGQAEAAPAQPFDVAGLLVARTDGTGGMPVWHIDATRGLDDPWSSVMRVGAMALAALLLAGHGLAFAVRLVQARRRRQAVDAFIAQRMPADGFGA